MRSRYKIIIFFLVTTFFSYAQQEPKPSDAIGDKVVIGFPEIQANQIDSIAKKVKAFPQIESAIFVKGIHNCLLLKFNNSFSNLATYYDLLKTVSPYYDVEKCYFKVDRAYAEILGMVKPKDYIIIK